MERNEKSISQIQEYVLDNPDLFDGNEQVTVSIYKVKQNNLINGEITYFEMSIKDFMRS